MSRMQIVETLINKTNAKKVCEVGVWEGDTTFHLLKKCPSIQEYYMVDPLSYDSNCFEYSENNGDFPISMKNNTYACTMGGPVRQQEQLDEIYNTIIKRAAPYNKVVFYREGSLDAVKRFEDQELDLVFIDAIHLYEYVKKDITAWLPKIKTGGIISGDDFCPTFPGVSKAVSEIFGNTVNVINSVWSVVKR